MSDGRRFFCACVPRDRGRPLRPPAADGQAPAAAGGVHGPRGEPTHDPRRHRARDTVRVPVVFFIPFGILSGLVWDLFGIRLGLVWDSFGIILGLVWDPFGILLGLVWDPLGPVWDPFGGTCLGPV